MIYPLHWDSGVHVGDTHQIKYLAQKLKSSHILLEAYGHWM